MKPVEFFGRGAYGAVRAVQKSYNETTDTVSVRTVAELTKKVANKISVSKDTDAKSREFSLLW